MDSRLIKYSLRSAHTRRPAYTLRLASIRHQTLAPQLCRFYKVPIPWTQGHPRDPTPPQENPPGTPPPGPRGGWGPRALGAVGRDGPMGPLGVIPKPFRMVSYSEAIPNGKLFRSQSEWKGRSEWMALPNGKLCPVFKQPRKRRTECRRIWLDFDGSEGWI